MVDTIGLELILGKNTLDLVVNYHNPTRKPGVGAINSDIIDAVCFLEKHYITNFYIDSARRVIHDGTFRFLRQGKDLDYEHYLNFNIDALHLRATFSPGENNKLGRLVYPHYDHQKIMSEITTALRLLSHEQDRHNRSCEDKARRKSLVAIVDSSHSPYTFFFNLSTISPSSTDPPKKQYALVVGFNGTSNDVVQSLQKCFTVCSADMVDAVSPALARFYSVMKSTHYDFVYSLVVVDARMYTHIPPQTADDPRLLFGSAASSQNIPIIALGSMTVEGLTSIERTAICPIETIEEVRQRPDKFRGVYASIRTILKNE